jgi:AAA domain-containing protein
MGCVRAAIGSNRKSRLKAVDYEQWAALPAERELVEPVTREKGKHKTRKVAAGFDIKDFLAFYGLHVDNETDNELGHCIRLTTCPLKGEAHAGHNSTTCNFIFPCKDGGLAYHCQSTGCVEYGIKEALEALEKAKGRYPKPIYEDSKKQPSSVRQSITIQRADTVTRESTHWLIPEFLPLREVTAFSGEMDTRKSTTAIDIAAKGSTGGGVNKGWFNNTAFDVPPFSTVYGGTEDSFPSTVLNRFLAAGGNPKAFGNIPLDVVNTNLECLPTTLQVLFGLILHDGPT